MLNVILQTASARIPGGGGLHRVGSILIHLLLHLQYKYVMNNDTRPPHQESRCAPAMLSRLPGSFCQVEFVPVKFIRSLAMGQQVANTVAARVEVELMGNLEGI
jgi:hypothetical protein